MARNGAHSFSWNMTWLANGMRVRARRVRVVRMTGFPQGCFVNPEGDPR
jgi:hypothetical protein